MPRRIHVKGVIVPDDDQWIYDWLGMEATSPKMINEQLEESNGESIEVIINSGGGSVFAGSEIYTMLKDYKGDVVVKIVGLAASAASVIAMAGKKVLISPTAQIMIHNASALVFGDYRDLQHGSDWLKNVNASIANAYILKSGMTQEQLFELMDKETWFNAQQALEFKLVDEIMFDDQNATKLIASANSSHMLPQVVIDKLRNELLKNNNSIAVHNPKNKNEPVKQDNKGDEEMKDLAELQAKYPELYQAAVQAGVEQERARIKELDELADASNQEIINKAKYETFISAPEAAMEILKANKQKLQNIGTKLKNDADTSGVNDVDPEDPTGDEYQDAEANASKLAEIINKRRGVK
jgi:ATP-dependent protease ClpP protease subunit